MEEEFSKIRDGFKLVFQVEIFHIKNSKDENRTFFEVTQSSNG